ncbi:alpha/beta hydrolase [Treponema sp.]|uniref:alpha/beta hydrolase n=1 Tax=Treponema sp. TaxID=166 RepID=UPI00388EF6BF
MKKKTGFIIGGSVLCFVFAAILGGAIYLVDYAVGGEDGTLCYESHSFVISKEMAKKKKHPQDIQAEKEKSVAYPKLKKYTEKVSIKSFDGLNLNGLYAEQKEMPSHNYALVVHGYRAEPRDMCTYAVHFLDKGWNVLLPGQRGHGWSEGSFVDMGTFACRDMVDWCRFIVEKDPEARILLYGVSMGAATVMMASGLELPSNVVAAVEDCGYTSVWDQFVYRLKYEFHLPVHPILDVASLLCKVKNGYSFRDGSSVRSLARAKIPMLFIHGDKDDYVPYEMLEKNFNAKSGEKEMLVVKNAIHATASFVDPELYYGRVDSFVDKWF